MRELVKDRDRLEHIKEAIGRILDFSRGKSKEELEEDNLKFYGIVKNIEIIGEAAYKLTRAFREMHPETDWNVISKMRNILVHEYYQIDSEQIWNVIQEDLDILNKQVGKQLEETNWQEWEKDERAISESAVHKSLLQTARRMKMDGLSISQILRYTGLNKDEIENL